MNENIKDAIVVATSATATDTATGHLRVAPTIMYVKERIVRGAWLSAREPEALFSALNKEKSDTKAVGVLHEFHHNSLEVPFKFYKTPRNS